MDPLNSRGALLRQQVAPAVLLYPLCRPAFVYFYQFHLDKKEGFFMRFLLRLWKALRASYYNIVSAFHPVRIDIRPPEGDNPDSRYMVHTTYGFNIEIQCQEIQFKKKHRVTEDTLGGVKHVYRVYCECSESTPEPLKSVMSAPRYVPCMASIFSTKEERHHQAIQTYLDVLNTELLRKGIV